MKPLPHFAVVLVALSMLGADAKSDKELLQGEWWAIASETNGKETAGESLKGPKRIIFRFIDDSLYVTQGWTEVPFTYEIDPSKTPKEIDIVHTFAGETTRRPGIYRLESDTLTICFGDRFVTERPEDFKTAPKDRRNKVTLARKEATGRRPK